MAKYRRKATYCDAEQFTGEPMRGVMFESGMAWVTTIQGQRVKIFPGEWVVAESDGKHFYPVANSVFQTLYEPAEAHYE